MPEQLCTTPFANFTEVPDPLRTTFTVALPNGENQVIYGLGEENFGRIFRPDGVFQMPEEPKAVQLPAYRMRCLEVLPYLYPFQPIEPHTAARLGIEIAVTANPHLIPYAVRVKAADYQPIGDIIYPGKSAHIDFTGISHIGNSPDLKLKRKEAIACYLQGVMDKAEIARSDALHVATVDELLDGGFVTYLASLKNKPLHVRLCDREIINKVDRGEELTHEDIDQSSVRLAGLWRTYS